MPKKKAGKQRSGVHARGAAKINLIGVVNTNTQKWRAHAAGKVSTNEVVPETRRVYKEAPAPPMPPPFDDIRERARAAAICAAAPHDLDFDRANWKMPRRFAEHAACGKLNKDTAYRCGGGLGMPAVVDKHGLKQAVPMPGGALVGFDGAILHGTFDHPEKEATSCEPGCTAHISLVSQFEGDTLHLDAEQTAKLNHDARVVARHDVLHSPVWRDALWVICTHDETATAEEVAPGHLGKPEPGEWQMHVHRRVVWWVNGLPILKYDADGATSTAKAAREHFEPLGKVPDSFWTLRRTAGNLDMDGIGKGKARQRMWMVGLRYSMRRIAKAARPTQTRPTLCLHVLNLRGDLDCYTDNYDRYDYLQKARPIFEGMGRAVEAHAPAGRAFRIAIANEIDLDARAFTRLHAGSFLTDDRFVGNVGVSSRYPAPAHPDERDVGLTWAIACKCGPRRKPGCRQDRELAELFDDKQRCWPCSA